MSSLAVTVHWIDQQEYETTIEIETEQVAQYMYSTVGRTLEPAELVRQFLTDHPEWKNLVTHRTVVGCESDVVIAVTAVGVNQDQNPG